MRSKTSAMAALAITVVTCMSAASVEDRHAALSESQIESVLVEHAEFEAVGNGYAGYLTVWNGTGADKTIKSLTVEGLDNAEIARRVSDDVVRTRVPLSLVTVPSKSELHMDAETLFVMLEGRRPPANPRIVVQFDDGSATSTTGRLLADEEALTDHHHPNASSPQ